MVSLENIKSPYFRTLCRAGISLFGHDPGKEGSFCSVPQLPSCFPHRNTRFILEFRRIDLICGKGAGMNEIKIALVGDYNEEVVAHGAIPQALRLSAGTIGAAVEPEWVPTDSLQGDIADVLANYQGIWITPGSPYRSMQGALNAIPWHHPTRLSVAFLVVTGQSRCTRHPK